MYIVLSLSRARYAVYVASLLPELKSFFKEEEKKGGRKGRLLGIITLSDVLRYVIGESGIGEGVEQDQKAEDVAS